MRILRFAKLGCALLLAIGAGFINTNEAVAGQAGDPAVAPTVPNPYPTHIPPPPPTPPKEGKMTVPPQTTSWSQTEIFQSDGYYWSLTYTWTRSINRNDDGTYTAGKWSVATTPTPPQKLGKVNAPSAAAAKSGSSTVE